MSEEGGQGENLQAGKPQKSKFVRLSKLGQPPPREEIVEGLVARGERVLLVGDPGAGKSTIAAALAAAISTGHDFLGRAIQRGEVAVLAAERGNGMHERLWAICANGGDVLLAKWRPTLPDHARLIVKELSRECVAPSLIVIDTLSRLIPGKDENSAGTMSEIFAAIDVIADAFPSAALVIVHHTSKASGSSRGSSASLGAVDLELFVERKPNSRALVARKANAVADGQRLTFRLDEGLGGLIAVADDGPQQSDQFQLQAEKNRARADQVAIRFAEHLPVGHFTIKDATVVARDCGFVGPDDKADTARKRVIRMLEKTCEKVDPPYSSSVVQWQRRAS